MGAPSVRKAEAFPLPHATLPVRSGMHSPVTVPCPSITEFYRWQDFRGQLTILFDESSSPSNSCVLNQTHDHFLQIWSLCHVSSLPIISPSNGSLHQRPILEDLFPLNFKPNSSPCAVDGVSSISLRSVHLVWATVKSWLSNCLTCFYSWSSPSSHEYGFPLRSDHTPSSCPLPLLPYLPALTPLLCIFQSWAPASLLPCTFC